MQNGQHEVPPATKAETLEYIFDMIAQLARLAQTAGCARVAIHLDALIAAERASDDQRA